MNAEPDHLIVKLQNENDELKILNKTLQFELDKLKLEYNELLNVTKRKTNVISSLEENDKDCVKNVLYNNNNEIKSLISLGDVIVSDLTGSLDSIKQEISVFSEQITQINSEQDEHTEEIRKFDKEEMCAMNHCPEKFDESTETYDCLQLLKKDTSLLKYDNSDRDVNALHDCINIRNVLLCDYYRLGGMDEILDELKCVSEIDDFLIRCKIDELIELLQLNCRISESFASKPKTSKLMAYLQLLSTSLLEIYTSKRMQHDEVDSRESELVVLESILNDRFVNDGKRRIDDDEEVDVVDKLKKVILILCKYVKEIKRKYRICAEERNRGKCRLINSNLLLDKIQTSQLEFNKIKNNVTPDSVCKSLECILNDIESVFDRLNTDQLIDISFNCEPPGKFKRLKEHFDRLTDSLERLEEYVNCTTNSDLPYAIGETVEYMKTELGNCDEEIDHFLTDNDELCKGLLKLPNVLENLNSAQQTDDLSGEILRFSRLLQIDDEKLKTVLRDGRINEDDLEVIRLLDKVTDDNISWFDDDDVRNTTEEKIVTYGGDKYICTERGLPVDETCNVNNVDESEIITINAGKDVVTLLPLDATEMNRLLHLRENIKLLMKLVTELKLFFADLSGVLRNLILEIPIIVNEVYAEIQLAIKNALESAVMSSESRNEDLLKDMLEMNTELKRRGEVISHLTESNEEMEKQNSRLLRQYEELQIDYNKEVMELKEETQSGDQLLKGKISEMEHMKQNYEQQINRLSSDVDKLEIGVNDLQRKLVEKEAIINDLEQEIGRRETQDGDTCSMGAVSRTEESARLHDVEDSFEDRYNKLRILAVKMKKRMAELNQQLETERNNFSSEKNELQNKLSQLMPKVKLSQTLQLECDKLNDMLELKETEISELKKIIKETDENILNLQTKVSFLTQQVDESKMTYELLAEDKKNLEEKITSLVSQLDKLEEEKGTKDSTNREKENEIEQLKQKINEGEENLKKLNGEFEQAKLEIRRQGTLSLEMKDYEKTISELMNQLTTENVKCKELNEKINESLKSNFILKQRINDLEAEIDTSNENNKRANEEILRLNKQIAELERLLSEREEALQQVIRVSETEKNKILELESELSRSLSLQSSEKENFENVQLSLTKQVNSLQMELTALKDQMKRRECELERLTKDFDNYKIRAQGILQKHKTESSAKSNEVIMKHQIENLEKTIEQLRKELTNNKNEFETYKIDTNALQLEKEKLSKRNKELATLVADKSAQFESLTAEFKTYKSDMEIRINSYQLEIERLGLLNKEVNDLRKKYEDAVSEIESLKQKIENSSEIMQSYSSSNYNSIVAHGLNADLQTRTRDIHRKISDVPSLPESNSFSNDKPILIPLESLLSNSADEDIVPKLKQQLLIYEEQIRNLEYMLHESEDSLTRNEHQVSVLKDEIRRLQRTIEREPHIKNTEYLKNIILKFLTLHHGDERACLVPVLETILKLSPDETKQLTSMAKDGTTENWSSWGSLLSWK